MMDFEREVLNGVADPLQDEEHEEELMQNHSHAEHRLRGLAHAWQVDVDEVHRVSRQIMEGHEARVEELRRQFQAGSYTPDSEAVAETLIKGEPAAHS